MKAQSIIAIAFLLLSSATGCIAQAGTDESSSAEDLSASSVAPNGANAAVPNANRNVAERGQQQQLTKAFTNAPTTELSTDPTNQGDPSQSGDPGDPTEPDPHPWHATPANVTAK